MAGNDKDNATKTTRADPIVSARIRRRRIRIFGIIIALLLSIPLLLLEFKVEKTHLEQVRSSGKLRVITFNGPTTYYRSGHSAAGFEYDLANAFAKSLGVELEIVVAKRFVDIMPEVLAGHADLAAAGLTITRQRAEHGVFSESYQTIKQQLIYRSGTRRPRKPADLVGRQIVVTAGSSHVDRLRQLQRKLPKLTWSEDEDETPESLLVQVWNGKIELTLADSNIVSVVRHYYPQLQIAFSLPPNDKLAWFFSRSNDDSLVKAANEFLHEVRKNGWLDRLLDKYYGPSSNFDYVDTTTYLRQIKDRLPLYGEVFRRAGKETGIDWRLLAAMAYQESHWDENAVSPTGVRGIMMLTRDTADRMKVKDRRDPVQSIMAGARYLKLLRDGLPKRIKEPDRTWLALAAYNIGRGHLEDARILAQKAGASPDTWLDVQRYLPLLTKPEWYEQTKYGYARGYEPVQYVNRIRGYYAILAWQDGKDQESLKAISSIDAPAL